MIELQRTAESTDFVEWRFAER